MPIDPTSTYSAAHTGYYVCKQTVGSIERVYVIAPGVEVFKTDGGCKDPAHTANDAMCVSG